VVPVAMVAAVPPGGRDLLLCVGGPGHLLGAPQQPQQVEVEGDLTGLLGRVRGAALSGDGLLCG
jgi:hypothetical protein